MKNANDPLKNNWCVPPKDRLAIKHVDIDTPGEKCLLYKLNLFRNDGKTIQSIYNLFHSMQ